MLLWNRYIKLRRIAIKFALNKNKINNYHKEGILLSKLSNDNFYPKIFNFYFNNKREYLAMTLMGPDLKKIIQFTKNHFLGPKTIRNIAIQLTNLF